MVDFLYTAIYLQASNRSKIENIYNSKNQKYDVLVLGSSGANNHVRAKMFEEKGLETFNYGMSGVHLFEASMLLKLVVERRYKINNVILEADLNLSNEHQAEGIAAQFLPYLHNSEVIKNILIKRQILKSCSTSLSIAIVNLMNESIFMKCYLI